MRITLRFWERQASDFSPNYNKECIKKYFEGKSAKDCMQQIDNYRNYHDLAQYTIPEIINVED